MNFSEPLNNSDPLAAEIYRPSAERGAAASAFLDNILDPPPAETSNRDATDEAVERYLQSEKESKNREFAYGVSLATDYYGKMPERFDFKNFNEYEFELDELFDDICEIEDIDDRYEVDYDDLGAKNERYEAFRRGFYKQALETYKTSKQQKKIFGRESDQVAIDDLVTYIEETPETLAGGGGGGGGATCSAFTDGANPKKKKKSRTKKKKSKVQAKSVPAKRKQELALKSGVAHLFPEGSSLTEGEPPFEPFVEATNTVTVTNNPQKGKRKKKKKKKKKVTLRGQGAEAAAALLKPAQTNSLQRRKHAPLTALKRGVRRIVVIKNPNAAAAAKQAYRGNTKKADKFVKKFLDLVRELESTHFSDIKLIEKITHLHTKAERKYKRALAFFHKAAMGEEVTTVEKLRGNRDRAEQNYLIIQRAFKRLQGKLVECDLERNSQNRAQIDELKKQLTELQRAHIRELSARRVANKMFQSKTDQ